MLVWAAQAGSATGLNSLTSYLLLMLTEAFTHGAAGVPLTPSEGMQAHLAWHHCKQPGTAECPAGSAGAH